MTNIVKFPPNPYTGQEETIGTVTYVWDGSKWGTKSRGFRDHNDTDNRDALGAHDTIYSRLIGQVADFASLVLPSGIKVKTKGYYTGSSKGAAEYEIFTLDEVRSAKEDHTWTPDERGEAFTLANGNVALLSESEFWDTHFGIRGDGVTDDTSDLIYYLQYCKLNNLIRRTSNHTILLTETVYTIDISDGIYTETDWYSDGTTLLCNHEGIGLQVRGGASRQRIRGVMYVTAHPDVEYTGTYVDTHRGCYVGNARHTIERIVCRNFKGEGFTLSVSGGNSNNSEHNVECYRNGKGVRIYSSKNDMSVIRSVIRAQSNGREGIYVHGQYMRQWVGWWYAENNWLEEPDNSSNFGVYIGKMIGCRLWIYSEQGNDASEIYARGTGEITSARRNADDIEGVTRRGSDGGRESTSRENVYPFLAGENRIGNFTEYTRALITGRLGDAYGYIEGRGDFVGFVSENEENGINVSNDVIRIGRKHIHDGEVVTFGGSDLNIKIPIGDSGYYDRPVVMKITVCGNTRGAGPNGNGTSAYEATLLVDGADNETFTINHSQDQNPSYPSSLTASVDSGGDDVLIRLSYDSSWYGDEYYMTYQVEFVSSGSKFDKRYIGS